jgi:hypothetical protein
MDSISKPDVFVNQCKYDLYKLYNKLLNDDFALRLYSTLRQTILIHKITFRLYSFTDRSAAGLISDIRNKGETYLTFYGSGYGYIDNKVKEEIEKLNYMVKTYFENEQRLGIFYDNGRNYFC